MDLNPVISKHRLLLEIILYNMNLQMTQLPIIVNRLIRNNHLVIENIDDYLHQIRITLQEEMIGMKKLTTDDSIQDYFARISILSDNTSFQLISTHFIYVHLVFGKGIQRFHLLHSLIFHNHYGLEMDIFSHGVVGVYVMINIVMYQFFSDGNHRTSLYLLELLLSTKTSRRLNLSRTDLFPLIAYMEQNRCIPFLYQEENDTFEVLQKRLELNFHLFQSFVGKLPYIDIFITNYISHF